MSNKNFDVVNFDSFAAQYMDKTNDSFVPHNSAIQVYPLSIAPTFINPPTPLFRTTYNSLRLFSNGGGKQQVDNETIDLATNDVLFIREGHLNAIKSIDPATEGYYIFIDSALLPQIFVDSTLLRRFTSYPKHSVTASEMEWLCKCCELMFHTKADTMYTTELRSALLKTIFLKLADASATAFPKPDRQSEITALFKELLYEHFSKNRVVKFYADALFVSENYLNRCVSYTTNKPPKVHINEMAVVYSKLLLQDYSKDISQVAFELNFLDPSYFGRWFKQLTDQTPTE